MAHVSLITIGVADLDRATGFYEALGWSRSSASVDGVVAFLRGSGPLVLGLFGAEDLAAESGVAASARSSGNLALAMNLPSEAEVDRVLELAASAGGRVTAPATRADWGGYSGYLTDPDGHLWEIAHNPGFPLHDDGHIDLPD